MVTEPLPSEATARSRNPSWLISPTTTFHGCRANGVIGWCVKCAIAIAQNDSNLVQAGICGHQILDAIAVEVADSQQSRR